ncbi:MAG: protein-L-isoaspartate(D-aspartate) O-methyltransferase [Sedimentisphaerales bacterium]|nr:protein-L-isoaspartate(D-aspartate) O-methyltransferase [Sedimentisphaerales bacterium]
MLDNSKNNFENMLLGAVLLAFLLLVGVCLRGEILFAADANQSAKKKHPSDPNDKKPNRPQHNHPAFGQRARERAKMVARQIKARSVTDPNVLKAMRTVPRHSFVRQSDLRRAYEDHPLPIGMGQTISQPYIVGYMTEKLNLDPNHKVLEVGTGSGYQAAVCAEIAKQVFTIEIIEALANSSGKRLKELGYNNVSVKAADGYYGWEEKAPFDAIIVTCAAGFIPQPLIKQLKPGGIMILPLGSPFGYQSLILVTKDNKGGVRSKTLLPVRFVPMLGRITKNKKTDAEK